MTVLKLSSSTKGIKDLIEFIKSNPALDFTVVVRDKTIIVRYDEKDLNKIISGDGKI